MGRGRIAGLLTILALVVMAPASAAAQADVPPTPWGDPDLQGVWDFRTVTPMERPEDRADQEFLTEEEAAAIEQAALDRNAELASRPARRTEADPTGNVDRGVDGAPGSYNNFWFDRGTSAVSTGRTSLVIDPPSGRIPPLTEEAQARRDALAEARRNTGPHQPTPGGWVDDLGANGLQVRCIVGFNAGPPMTPGGYNNNMQLFQTPDAVVIYNEMNHNPRVIPLDDRPVTGLRQWAGESRGRWEGDTPRRRDDELSARDQLHARRRHRRPAACRALHPGFARRAAVRGDGRRPEHLDRPLDVRGPDAVEPGADLRVRLPRGELLDGGHSGRRPGGRGRGEEDSSR